MIADESGKSQVTVCDFGEIFVALSKLCVCLAQLGVSSRTSKFSQRRQSLEIMGKTVLLLISVFWGLVCSSYWHGYDPARVASPDNSHECQSFHEHHSKANIADMTKRYKFWPDLVASQAKINHSSVVFGFGHAVEEIWKRQHPKDCAKEKFFINGFHLGGFGSSLHVSSAAFGLAMNLNRVYLQNPFMFDGERWIWDVPHCQNQSVKHQNLECYFEPWSSCTIYDALGPKALSILETLHPEHHLALSPELSELKSSHVDILRSNDAVAIERLITELSGQRVLFFPSMPSLKHGVVPLAFEPLLKCSPMVPQFHYYWYRAVTMAYIVRPNDATRAWLRAHRIEDLEGTPEHVGVYVRRGDKAVEMHLVPTKEYTSAIDLIYSHNYVPSMSQTSATNLTSERRIFLASEDMGVIEEVTAWVAQQNSLTNSSSSSLSYTYRLNFTNFFDRRTMLAALTTEQLREHFKRSDHHGSNNVVHQSHPVVHTPVHTTPAHTPVHTHQPPPRQIIGHGHHGLRRQLSSRSLSNVMDARHHDLEYLSMLLNVHYLVRAGAYVCTLASNFCRVIDELRATVGAKADRVFVDLSHETCHHDPPCISAVSDFDWRL